MNWQRLSQFLHLQAFVFRIDAFLTDENTVWTLASCPAPRRSSRWSSHKVYISGFCWVFKSSVSSMSWLQCLSAQERKGKLGKSGKSGKSGRHPGWSSRGIFGRLWQERISSSKERPATPSTSCSQGQSMSSRSRVAPLYWVTRG